MNEIVKFEELNLSKDILNAISEMGFEKASPIQAQAIPFIVEGQDVTGLAMTGTGKTAAFGLPLIDKIDPQNKNTQALILCPTRELAIQISSELTKYAKYKKRMTILSVYGGQPIERQLYALSRGVQIVVGTPGRLMDHMDRRTLDLSAIKMVVLDEADEMLNMGFRADIESILKVLPKERQTVTFSATMSKDILDLVKKYQRQPEIVKVSNDNSTATTVEQCYYDVPSASKLALFTKLMEEHKPYMAIVFCNTKRKVDNLATKLRRGGYSVEGLHGDISQPKRNRVMDRFRAGHVQVLIATDVAARGIDVPNIDIVFNYELPKEEKAYVHRIGRTGRAGKTGMAISFVGESERYTFRGIQRYTNANFVYKNLPILDLVASDEKISSYSDAQSSSNDSINSEDRPNKLILNVKKILEQKDLSHHIQTVESLMSNNNPPIMVAAALFELLSQNNSDSGSRSNRYSFSGRSSSNYSSDRSDRSDSYSRKPRSSRRYR
ncbi:MAG: DEAD/DEAH box helicase domain protein [candidate division TM6 bacterium GW2011_GWF2_37_49]|nr:MAG: DEAD/DEAH box helicase domain protein [candidate division TM6 bacterium GW2011_GWF2_37_49]